MPAYLTLLDFNPPDYMNEATHCEAIPPLFLFSPKAYLRFLFLHTLTCALHLNDNKNKQKINFVPLGILQINYEFPR